MGRDTRLPRVRCVSNYQLHHDGGGFQPGRCEWRPNLWESSWCSSSRRASTPRASFCEGFAAAGGPSDELHLWPGPGAHEGRCSTRYPASGCPQYSTSALGSHKPGLNVHAGHDDMMSVPIAAGACFSPATAGSRRLCLDLAACGRASPTHRSLNVRTAS